MAMTPITPLEPGVEMFQRASKSSSFFFAPRSDKPRPLSEATEIFDTDFEDDSSVFEEDSPKYSFDSSDSRRSQTTLSSFDEVATPEGNQNGFEFKTTGQMVHAKPVEGPRGPHLFRASQSSMDFDYEYALQMSPLLPKQTPLHPMNVLLDSAPLVQTPATIVAPNQPLRTNFTNPMALQDSSDVSQWTAQDVASWMYRLGFEETVIDKFEVHDITGQVLLDMQFDDLKELDITSFGKRHQLWVHIESLRDNDGHISPAPTPFQDISRPATRATREDGKRERSKSRNGKRSKSRKEACEGEEQGTTRRGRRQRNGHDDVITPGESVSIVAIEQLLPKPHKCAKGERCAKWRKQQRQLARLHEEHGFPISPEKGGHIYIAGDPGNANVAETVVQNVYRPTSENVPSVVASSAALAPEHMPEISLQEEMLRFIESRDPQDNVKQFLHLQGVEAPYMEEYTPVESPPTPPLEMFPPLSHQTFAQQQQQYQQPLSNLKSLPKLSIPRAASANPAGEREPLSAFSPCRTAQSPVGNLADLWNSHASLHRFGTPATEMDVPLTAVPEDPYGRDNSQSVPPNMQFRDPIMRSTSAVNWRRPSFALPSLQEGQVFSPVEANDEEEDPVTPTEAQPRLSESSTLHERLSRSYSKSASNSPIKSPTNGHPLSVHGHDLRPPSNASNISSHHYPGVTHAGWMKKRKTKLLRHEWNDAHFRLNGTLLTQHANALPSSSTLAAIDVDDYAVACSSIASNKLSAKLRALKISSGQTAGSSDSAFSFQLVPTVPEGSSERRKLVSSARTHHFAVKNRDERIDWMRELMLAKALKAKGEGYEVQVYGKDS